MSDERREARDRTGKGTRGRPFQVSGFGLVYDGYGGDGRWRCSRENERAVQRVDRWAGRDDHPVRKAQRSQSVLRGMVQ